MRKWMYIVVMLIFTTATYSESTIFDDREESVGIYDSVIIGDRPRFT